MKSKDLIKSVKTLRYWRQQYKSALWRELSSLGLSENERFKRNKMDNDLWDHNKLIEEFYAARIGKAIMLEVE